MKSEMMLSFENRTLDIAACFRIVIVLIGPIIFSRPTWCQADCKRTDLGAVTSGQFQLPSHSGGYLVDDICVWTIEPDFEEYVIIIDSKETILADYENKITSTCAAALVLNGEALDCHRREPFCFAYSTSDKCSYVLSEYPICQKRTQTTAKFELEFDAYLYNSNTQKFDVRYKVLECEERPAITVAKRLQTPPGAVHDFYPGNVTTSTVRTSTSHTAPNRLELIVILLPFGIVIMVVFVMLIWCRRRRAKIKSAEDDSYQSEGNSVGATRNTTANIAYEAWSPPKDHRPSLPDRGTVGRNLIIPNITIPEFECSDSNVYEAISAPPPSIITPRFSEMGQRYFEIGFNRLNMDFMDRTENIYEGGDANFIANQDPYDMAIPNPTNTKEIQA